jgi:F-type H+-transporting ATPase subunit a
MEQFEPVPFFTLYFNDINLSFTNIGITFIYVALVLSYLSNGFLFDIKNSNPIEITHSEKGALNFGVLNVSALQLNTLKSSFNSLIMNSNKVISFVSFLSFVFNSKNNINSKKAEWLGSTFKSKQTAISKIFYYNFYKVLYGIMYSGNLNVSKVANLNFLNQAWRSFLNNKNSIVSKSLKDNSSLYALSVNTYFSKDYANTLIPKANFWFFENIYAGILGVVKETIGGSNRESVKFFPFIFTIFLTILLANALGLIPYGTTVTSYLIITLGLTLTVWIGTFTIAAQRFGIQYFGHFLPSGIPVGMYPFLVVIELISYFMRVVSLSVRLFANMFAGHTLLVVLSGFGWGMMTSTISVFVFYPMPILAVLVLVGLETGVAFIQAYVFTMLTCIYIDEAINPHIH